MILIFSLLACEATPTGPPNILLVSLDTTRADRLTPYRHPRDTTPTLAALAREGTTFLHAYSQGNESAYSHGAMFTGRYASELARPDYTTYGVPASATFVSEALQAHGYRTAAFSAGGHVTADFGFDQGWDQFSAERGFASLWITAPRAAAWIAQDDPRPWFAFVHAYDAHRPYVRTGPWDHLYAQGPGSRLAETILRSPCVSEMVLADALYPEAVPEWFVHGGGAKILDPDSYTRLRAAAATGAGVPLTPADRAHILDHYDGGLTYADAQLGVFLAGLQASGALDHTVVLVVSDHGEDLLDHGYMNHRVGLYDSCTHVPTVAWGPGFEPGAQVDALVDSRDVAGTLLGLAGVRPPVGSGGRDLRAVARGEGLVDAVFSEGVMDHVTVRTPTHRLVFGGTPLQAPDHLERLRNAPLAPPAFELYDHRVDPGESTNRVLEDPTTAAALRERLVQWRAGLDVSNYSLDASGVSAEQAEELRKHGYWGIEGGAPKVAPPAASEGAKANAPFIDRSCEDRVQFLPPSPTTPGGSPE